MSAPTFRVIEIELRERPVALRIPFRFGAATVTHAPQAFVRARIELADATSSGTVGEGAAAELMIPKWFDKSPLKSNAENVADLRMALANVIVIAHGVWPRCGALPSPARGRRDAGTQRACRRLRPGARRSRDPGCAVSRHGLVVQRRHPW
jgi:hypothetical protein